MKSPSQNMSAVPRYVQGNLLFATDAETVAELTLLLVSTWMIMLNVVDWKGYILYTYMLSLPDTIDTIFVTD